jgi:hypothetical protein
MYLVNCRYYCYSPGLSENLEGLPSEGRQGGWIRKRVYFLEIYIGTDDWQCRYIQGRVLYACRYKQGRKARALWTVSLYHKVYDAIAEVTHKVRSQ